MDCQWGRVGVQRSWVCGENPPEACDAPRKDKGQGTTVPPVSPSCLLPAWPGVAGSWVAQSWGPAQPLHTYASWPHGPALPRLTHLGVVEGEGGLARHGHAVGAPHEQREVGCREGEGCLCGCGWVSGWMGGVRGGGGRGRVDEVGWRNLLQAPRRFSVHPQAHGHLRRPVATSATSAHMPRQQPLPATVRHRHSRMSAGQPVPSYLPHQGDCCSSA